MRKLVNLIVRTCVLLGIILTLLILFTPYILKNYIYIRPYDDFVDEASNAFNIDKNLIYSVMKVESKFNKEAVSRKKAKGLMQLMTPTAEEIVQEININNVTTDLFNPRNNIIIGTKYLSKLLIRYDKDINVAIAAYNAGIGNVDKWIKEGTITLHDSSSLDNIPFRETRTYVKKVGKAYKIYKEQLYE